MYKEKIINVETGEETWRDYTAEEIAEVEKNKLSAEKRNAEILEKEKTKKAILTKLGITEDEAKLLLS